eukprot:454711_1
MRLGMDHVVPGAIRVATYNMLSPNLAVPQNYPTYSPKVLDPSSRLSRVQQKLEPEVEMGSVIALQELSISWLGPMHKWMRDREYCLVAGQYGNAKNGYMGIALAIPPSVEIVDLQVNRVSSTRKWGYTPTPGKMEEIMKRVKKLTTWGKSFLPFTQEEERLQSSSPMQEPFLHSKRRFNQMVFSRLRTKGESASNRKEFCVATYHMPCVFYDERVMAIHTALACQHAQRLAGLDPLILAGDFNIMPMNHCYDLITKSVLPEGSAANPVSPEWETKADPDWKLELERPMYSAYATVQGSEPEFTNWAQSSFGGEFKGTLDYIFYCGDGIEVKEVLELMSPEEVNGPLPTADEVSDHLLLAANFELHGK